MTWQRAFVAELFCLLLIFGVCAAIPRFVLFHGCVEHSSMEPTLHEGTHFIADRLAYAGGNAVQRGDVIVFSRADSAKLLVKRVVGLPGETVRITGGVLKIDDRVLEHSGLFVEEPMDTPDGVWEVPAGCYFVLGDNRENSRDSRFWDEAFVPAGDVQARVWLLLEPKGAAFPRISVLPR